MPAAVFHVPDSFPPAAGDFFDQVCPRHALRVAVSSGGGGHQAAVWTWQCCWIGEAQLKYHLLLNAQTCRHACLFLLLSLPHLVGGPSAWGPVNNCWAQTAHRAESALLCCDMQVPLVPKAPAPPNGWQAWSQGVIQALPGITSMPLSEEEVSHGTNVFSTHRVH